MLRLLEDLRILGPSGVQRAARAPRQAAAAAAGRTAAKRRAEDDPQWREAEAEVSRVARGESWMAVEQADREAALAAALDALLAVLERRQLDDAEYDRLVRPMSAALPWLLSGEAETGYD